MLLIGSAPSFSQEIQRSLKPLKGMIVNSENDEFLAGVHVFAKMAHQGAVSDQNGVFEMVVEARDTLIITFVGFQRQVLPLNYFREDKIDILISMDPDIIELPGITILGEPNIDYLMRKDRNPLKVHGLQAPSSKPEVDVPVGSTDYGPLSRWGKEAKEKRKLMKVYAETQRERIYTQTVSSDSVKQVFIHRYGITATEYNDFVIFLNIQRPLMDKQDPKDIVRVMHQMFLKYRPSRN